MDDEKYSNNKDSNTKPQLSTSMMKIQENNIKIQHLQAKLDIMMRLMKICEDETLKRKENLSELDDRVDALSMGAASFEQREKNLKTNGEESSDNEELDTKSQASISAINIQKNNMKIQEAQAQLDKIIERMNLNVDQMLKRNEKLDNSVDEVQERKLTNDKENYRVEGSNVKSQPSVPTNEIKEISIKLKEAQAMLDQLAKVTRTNMDKVTERDEKLLELENRVDALPTGAQTFIQQEKKLKKKYWWKIFKK